MNLNERQISMIKSGLNKGMTGKEIANFLAQASYESAQLQRLEERFIYKSPSVIQNIMGKVHSSQREGHDAFENARKEALNGKPEKLAELMYGGRMGNDQPGDGWKYRGRGYIQLTGKGNYRAASLRLGIDLVNNPDLLARPDVAGKVAFDFWEHNVHGKAKEDVMLATERVNGKVGKDFSGRKALFELFEEKLTPEFLGQIKNNGKTPDREHKTYRRSDAGEVLTPSTTATQTIGNPGELQPKFAFGNAQQSQLDRVLELMAEKPAFAVFTHEQKTQMAMGIMKTAAEMHEPIDKIAEVSFPQNGQTLAARFNSEPGMIDLPTQEALKTTPQEVVTAQAAQLAQEQQMLLVQQQQSKGMVIG